MMDVVFINPGNRRQVFQGLGADLAAIEPPVWIAMLAAHIRDRRCEVAIIDANAENMAPEDVAGRVNALQPKLAALIVYGAQPSASTQNMPAAGAIAKELKARCSCPVAFGGLHPSALPLRTLTEEATDYVVDGEGFDTFSELLKRLAAKSAPDLDSVPGLWWKDGAGHRHTARAPLVDLDRCFAASAWDLLPMPGYRAHNWHCFDDIRRRQPYAAVYTSLGCPFHCAFCCIQAPFGKPGIRFRAPHLVLKELETLVSRHGVRNLKIADELFILTERHYLPIIEGIIERGLPLNIWAYARVDTVRARDLARMKRAGINWLALGIESANPEVRDGASKGMRVENVKDVVRQIQENGIRVIGNYIFGLPDDDLNTMRQTLDMAMELNCEFANFYCAMAYPGSRLYETAIENHWALPDSWSGYSQHAYDCLPLPTNHISAAEVLRFRDGAFHAYFSNPAYIGMITERFGPEVAAHVRTAGSTRLRRRLLE